MPHPKAKPITIDGVEYLIAPLSMSAIETLVESTSGPGTLNEKRAAIWEAIYSSLMRAGGRVSTLPELKDTLDVEGFLQLQQAVYELSAVRAVS